MNFDEIKQTEAQAIMPTYGRFDIAITSGHGSTAVDTNGKEYIDFGSGIGVNCLGYCDEGWVNAISAQAAKLQHTSNLYYTQPQTELAKKLCDVSRFSKVFLANSGAEANECAIKLARKYSFDKYGDGRNKILSIRNSFHGRTITTLAATGQDSFHNFFMPFTSGFDYLDIPTLCAKNARNFDIKKTCEKIGDDVCAVMIELIQGEGGVDCFAPNLIHALRDFCKQKDILFIVDEVQTGVGRTGTMFAYQSYHIRPDIVTLAKGLGGGLPIGACMCNDKLSGVLSAGMHASTFGGNPVACAGANYILDVVSNKNFLEEVRHKGHTMLERFEPLSSENSAKFEARGMGMMFGIKLPDDMNPRDVAVKCAENGLLVLTAKGNVVRLLPPLNISYDDLEKGLDILEKVLEKESNQ